MPAQQAEVFEKVRNCLVDALGVDDDEVTPEATMVGDLGAESIDFLDIVFRLEKTFNIKIPRGRIVPRGYSQQRPICPRWQGNGRGDWHAEAADALCGSHKI